MERTIQKLEIPISAIAAGENDRKMFSDTELAALAESIDIHGLAQPIVIRPVCDHSLEAWTTWGEPGQRFEIVAGERRFRALKRLGRLTIRATVFDRSVEAVVRELGDGQAAALMLAENTARVNLRPSEEAKAYRKRIVAGDTESQVAGGAGVSVWTVKRRLALLRLPDYILAAIDRPHPENFPLAHAEALEGMSQAGIQGAFSVWKKIGRGMSKHSFARLCQKITEREAEDAGFDFFELAETVEPVDPRLTCVIIREIQTLIAFTQMTPRQRSEWVKRNPAGFERVKAWLKAKGAECP